MQGRDGRRTATPPREHDGERIHVETHRRSPAALMLSPRPAKSFRWGVVRARNLGRGGSILGPATGGTLPAWPLFLSLRGVYPIAREARTVS